MIKYKVSDLNIIHNYFDLYKRCFKDYDKNIAYLKWLYSENPKGNFIGIDAFDGYKLVGQIGGIPLNFKFFNNPIKTLISINICIDERYRGSRIFFNLARILEKHLIENEFELLIGVGNKIATPAWIRSIKLKYLCPLKTFFGFYDFSKSTPLMENYNLYVEWTNELIKWRSLNPYNNTKIFNYKNKKLISAKTKIPLVNVYSPLPFEIKNKIIKNVNNDFNLKVFVGLSNEINQNFLFRKIPNIFKPSPLNFLYKFLNKEYNLDQSEIFISFLDFDAF
tara:strand:+ start:88 stop:924 length:837 start_codon:yes stop_codon:yes gene_type:complete